MYVKIENTRLNFISHNQAQLWVELYQGLMDTMHSGESCAANVGHRVILHPSFIGGPRDMKKQYLNAMALVRRYGKPDTFPTIMCNANWIDIKQELAEGEHAEDRQDLVSRIFSCKIGCFEEGNQEKKLCGEVVAIIHVIEFQKHDLPHALFLLFCSPSRRLRS